MDNIVTKLKSKVVWVTAIPMICYLFYAVKSGDFNLETVLLTVVDLLALFGILNNPNDRESF